MELLGAADGRAGFRRSPRGASRVDSGARIRATSRPSSRRRSRRSSTERRPPTRARADFERAFSRREIPEEMEERSAEPDLADAGAATVLVRTGLAESMREARRKIAEGALTVYASGEERVMRDPNEKILAGESRVLRLGRRFLPRRSRSARNLAGGAPAFAPRLPTRSAWRAPHDGPSAETPPGSRAERRGFPAGKRRPRASATRSPGVRSARASPRPRPEAPKEILPRRTRACALRENGAKSRRCVSKRTTSAIIGRCMCVTSSIAPAVRGGRKSASEPR